MALTGLSCVVRDGACGARVQRPQRPPSSVEKPPPGGLRLASVVLDRDVRHEGRHTRPPPPGLGFFAFHFDEDLDEVPNAAVTRAVSSTTCPTLIGCTKDSSSIPAVMAMRPVVALGANGGAKIDPGEDPTAEHVAQQVGVRRQDVLRHLGQRTGGRAGLHVHLGYLVQADHARRSPSYFEAASLCAELGNEAMAIRHLSQQVEQGNRLLAIPQHGRFGCRVGKP